jgi:acetoin utilization deacetylase AcuC-like enzyme
LAVYEALVALEQRLVVGDNPAARRYIALDFAGASKETICRVHSTAHYDFLESTSHWSRRALRKLTAAADDLYYNRATFGAAVLAAGGCVAVAQAVTAPVSGSRRAMALVRPPSHHATRNAAMGTFIHTNERKNERTKQQCLP